MLLKIDSMGNLLWRQAFSGEDGAYWLRSAIETPDLGYIAVGSISSNTAGHILIIKTDHSGNTIWNATYGGNKDDSAYSITIANEVDFAVAGRLNDKVWLAKFGDELIFDTQSAYVLSLAAIAILSVLLLLVVLILKRKRKNSLSPLVTQVNGFSTSSIK